MEDVQIGEHFLYLQTRDGCDQVHPVCTDVGDRPQRSTLIRENSPVVVGDIKQPVLYVAAIDCIDGTQTPGCNHVPGLQIEGIESEVVTNSCGNLFTSGDLDQFSGFV